MKKYAALLALVSLVVIVPLSADAAILKGGDDLYVTIPIEDDLYIGGAQVIVREKIDGDLLIAAGDVKVHGNTTEDLLVAAGNATLYGDVGDDLRLAAGNVNIGAQIQDDVFIAAGSAKFDRLSHIVGDARISARDVVLDGHIEGNVTIQANEVVITGVIDGIVEIEASEVLIDGVLHSSSTIISDRIIIERNGLFNADLTYWNEAGVRDFGYAIQNGSARFDPELAPRSSRFKPWSFQERLLGPIGRFITSISFGSFFILLFALITRTFFHEAARTLEERPKFCIFRGITYFIVTPIIFIILLMTIVGIPVALLMASSYAFSLYFARPLSSLVLARVLEQHYKKKWSDWIFAAVGIGVFALLKFLSYIPYIGWIITIVVVSGAYGALLKTKFEKFLEIR